MKSKLLDNTAEVDAYMDQLDHTGRSVVEFLRPAILAVDSRITEGIKWNAPCFYYEGDMAVFNLHPKSPARMIFINGASIDAEDGLFDTRYPDGRGLIVFQDLEDAKTRLPKLTSAIQRWIVWSDGQKGGE